MHAFERFCNKNRRLHDCLWRVINPERAASGLFTQVCIYLFVLIQEIEKLETAHSLQLNIYKYTSCSFNLSEANVYSEDPSGEHNDDDDDDESLSTITQPVAGLSFRPFSNKLFICFHIARNDSIAGAELPDVAS